MGWLSPEYKTYQDVKNTIAIWGIVPWGLFLYLFLVYLLSIDLSPALGQLASSKGLLGELGPIGALVALGGILSGVFTHLIEFHDHVYDRYIKRWRDRYHRDVLVPQLVWPFTSKLDPRFQKVVQTYPREFLESAYYDFVGDRDPKIDKNKVVRFYERITKYWFAEVCEFLFVALAALVFLRMLASYLIGEPLRSAQLLPPLTISGIVLVTKIYLNAPLVNSVRQGTIDQIDAIHENHKDELEDKIRDFSDIHNLSYG